MIGEIRVKCDKCDWKEATESLEVWLNKPCPKCNDSIIVTEKEYVAFQGIKAFSDLCDVIAKFFPKDQPTVTIPIDSVKLFDR